MKKALIEKELEFQKNKMEASFDKINFDYLLKVKKIYLF